MATKHQEMQRFVRYYKEKTGEKEVDPKEVAAFAAVHNWPLPEPIDPLTRLAKQFSEALREETREDKVTGRPYRANHVYPVPKGPGKEQLWLWVDIDEAERGPMFKSLQMRREQMVGDAVHLKYDADHWNRINPEKNPITLEFDFGPDIAWREAGTADEESKAS